MSEIKTRFAPSPTGFMHIGGVRTALYEYLVAKKNNGKFYLRIEDSDRNRFVEGATEDIIESLKWLGLDFEGEPIIQSSRLKTYQEHAKKLVDEGKAYEKEGAIWFKMNLEGTTGITDLVGNRKIEFPNKDQKDFVLLKSDGYPTYHLAHIVDDHLMETNPVIRAAEWISSIPKHVQLFEAFGWEVPQYAHLPIILGTDKAKLSKRHGAKAVSEFRKDGFLPEAILNYMAFLGWTPKSGKEMLTVDEMAKEFDLKDVHVTNPIFDITKLEWMNGEYIRKMSDDELEKRLEEFLSDHPGKGKISKLIPLVKERIKKLSDFIPLTNFFFYQPEYDLSPFRKLKIGEDEPRVKKTLEEILGVLENLPKPWKAVDFEETFKKYAQEKDLTNFDVFQLIRIAVSGQLVTPPLFESIEILGEEETLKRIKNVAEKYPDFPDEAKDLDIETSD